MVTQEEYQLYDIVCVGSRHYARELQAKLTVPVYPLLQCTDTELFYPDQEAECSVEKIIYLLEIPVVWPAPVYYGQHRISFR